MRVENLEQMMMSYGLVRTRSKIQRVLFYLAVGESDSEYTFDFLGAEISSYLRDREVPQADKLVLLGNLYAVALHSRDSHLYRLESLGPRQPLYYDWVNAPPRRCESLKDEKRMRYESVCPECSAPEGLHFSDCKEF